MIYFQGHPEYDKNSLLKEYKREVFRFLEGELNTPPPFPENYFSADARAIAGRFFEQTRHARLNNEPLPEFPEEEIETMLDNTWGDTAKALVNNWLGLVYKVTNLERKKLFMKDVDPDDPLGLKT
jgi:homoserine O-succinyltransferase